jgi:hypothetical protein
MAMLLRSRKHPVPGFPVLLTDEQDAAAQAIEDAYDNGLHFHEATHKFCYSLLSTYRHEVITDEWLCLLRRFLVLYHLQDDGTFCPVHLIPPNLSKLQWFFRAMACYEACTRQEDYGDGIFGSESLLFAVLQSDAWPTDFITPF